MIKQDDWLVQPGLHFLPWTSLFQGPPHSSPSYFGFWEGGGGAWVCPGDVEQLAAQGPLSPPPALTLQQRLSGTGGQVPLFVDTYVRRLVLLVGVLVRPFWASVAQLPSYKCAAEKGDGL